MSIRCVCRDRAISRSVRFFTDHAGKCTVCCVQQSHSTVGVAVAGLANNVPVRLSASSEKLKVKPLSLRAHFVFGLWRIDAYPGCANECFPDHISGEILSSHIRSPGIVGCTGPHTVGWLGSLTQNSPKLLFFWAIFVLNLVHGIAKSLYHYFFAFSK